MPNKAFYDLHVHSCLSPCGDVDMTPNNIAGMSSIKGLNVVALTDHNTCGNCPAFFSACSRYSILAIAGAEITTSEDIHVVTLFETLEGAMDFDSYLAEKRVLYKNEPDIFGKQLYMDADDNILREEPYLLVNSVDISIDDIGKIVSSYGGIAYPAHIDKASNSIVSVFGMIPEYDFTTYELADIKKADEFETRFPIIKNKTHVNSSDAHYLWDISEKINYLTVLSDLSDHKALTKEIFAILRGESV